MISAVFGADVSHQSALQTPSRRYHWMARHWNLFLLASPFLGLLTLWSKAVNFRAAVALFVWSVLVMTATSLGSSEVVYRYLHPFSFTGLAAAAALVETWKKNREQAIT
jgi:polyferredoxin